MGDGFPGYPSDNTNLSIPALVSWGACGGLTVPYSVSAPGVSAPSEATANLDAASQPVVAPQQRPSNKICWQNQQVRSKSSKLDKNPSDKFLGAVTPVLAARKQGRKLLRQGEK